jgi:TRAP-type C4-dicarboxylate transport system substrate-binding protein
VTRTTLLAGCALLCATATAIAGETLRMAVAPPDGTSYARELRAFQREVDQATNGALKIRLYMGGIAGDELEVGERIKRGQLDGTASAGMLCQDAIPSFRAMRVFGLFTSRGEVDYILGRLEPQFAGEAAQRGYTYLGGASMGPTIALSRVPLRTLDDLKRVKLWRWDLDEVALKMGKRMGLRQVAMPLEQAARAYDEGQIDGFYSIPVAALAFGFHAYARYLLDLRIDFLAGCMLFSSRSFNRLPIASQKALEAAAAKLGARIGRVGELEDRALLGGILARSGIETTPVSAELRASFLRAARGAREELGDGLVAGELVQRILALLADYRNEHEEHEPQRKR